MVNLTCNLLVQLKKTADAAEEEEEDLPAKDAEKQGRGLQGKPLANSLKKVGKSPLVFADTSFVSTDTDSANDSPLKVEKKEAADPKHSISR